MIFKQQYDVNVQSIVQWSPTYTFDNTGIAVMVMSLVGSVRVCAYV